MSSTPSALGKLTVSRSRPSAGPIQASSPHTPLSRSVSGLYGSPGSSFRIEDEHLLIFELGARNLRAGFAGEYAPRCSITYSPELWRRVGDYRQWDPEHEKKRRNLDLAWGDQYELWNMDLRDSDLGLVGDRIEKLIREAESKYLLLDNRAKKVSLVTPSSLPRPLLDLMISKIFEGLQAATVTVLPSAVMVALSAGVRSALVVDIGWCETTVTAVYDYRETMQRQSIRAGKMLSHEFAKMLQKEDEMSRSSSNGVIDFDEAEEIMRRVAWCKDLQSARQRPLEDDDSKMAIPLSRCTSAAEAALDIRFDKLAEPAELVLLAKEKESGSNDDEELPLPDLLYRTLLHLSADVRSICLSNIIFTGGVSQLPGLKRRILQELDTMIQSRNWDHIHRYSRNVNTQESASATTPWAKTRSDRSPSVTPPRKRMSSPALTQSSEPASSTIAAHARAHDSNTIDAKLTSLAIKDAVPALPNGELRVIEALGPWAGASLMTNLRIRGVVEIERERYMSHGLTGGALPGSGKSSASVAQEAYPKARQSLGANAKVAGEKSVGWSLGVWG